MKINYKPRYYFTNFEEEYYKHGCFFMADNKPSLVTLKPTLNCVANCKHCSRRNKKFDQNREFTLKEYDDLFTDFKKNGVKQVCISGGEPLIYKDIVKLVNMIVRKGMNVTINTNGWLLTENLFDQLMKAGIAGINLSIDSPYADVHNRLRGLNGLFEKAIENIKRCRKKNKKFILNLRIILSKYNYQDICKMIELSKNIDADILSIDMIEDDCDDKSFLLNSAQIKEFKSSCTKDISVCINKLKLKTELESFNIKQLNNIFNIKFNTIENYENGIYWPNEIIKKKCAIPNSFMIVEGDGSVLPCNAVEYNRKFIVGNLFENNVNSIWNSKKMILFRKNKMNWCRKCPMNMSFMFIFNDREIKRNI